MSHSSQEDKAVLDAVVAAFRRRADDFALLMDTEELKAGDAWRARINLWLGACDAAVLLLSEQALGKPWVLYEAAILSYRNRNDDFLVIPVLLNDPEAKMLKDPRLDAPHVSQIQAVMKNDPAEIAAAVIERLEGYRPRSSRPIDAAVSRILTILHNMPSHLLEEGARYLELELPWEPNEDPLVPFAEKLLAASVDDAIDALLAIRDFVASDRKRLKILIDLVAASWVDPKAVEELPEISRAASCRAVALNAVLAETARMYQVASCPTNRAHFVSCGDVVAEPPNERPLAQEMTAKVEAELRAYMKVPPGADVRAALKRADRMIVFVAVPAVGFTDAVIETLQNEFPTVTFFFLTGSQGAPPGALDRKLLKVIVPQLLEAEESVFNANQQRLVANVDESLDWSP